MIINYLLLSSSQIGMRSRNRVRAFFACAILQIHRIFIAIGLSIPEDETIGANTLFLNQVIDHGVYTFPAQFLCCLAGFSVTDYGDLTIGAIAQFVSGAGQQGFGIMAEGNRSALKADAGQV